MKENENKIRVSKAKRDREKAAIRELGCKHAPIKLGNLPIKNQSKLTLQLLKRHKRYIPEPLVSIENTFGLEFVSSSFGVTKAGRPRFTVIYREATGHICRVRWAYVVRDDGAMTWELLGYDLHGGRRGRERERRRQRELKLMEKDFKEFMSGLIKGKDNEIHQRKNQD